MVAIADMGSGPSIIKLMDLVTAQADYPEVLATLDSPDLQLLTADGSLMKNLTGATDIQIRRPGSQVSIGTRAQVLTSSTMTPIIGVEVWDAWKAQFDFKDKCIRVQAEDGTLDAIPFWISPRKRRQACAVVSKAA